MKRTLHTTKQKAMLLAMLLVAASAARGQSHGFAPVGAEWHYEVHEMFAKGYIRMSVEKDTVINGMECIKLKREKHSVDSQSNALNDVWMYPEFLAWTNDSCMYYRDGQFHLLFDFGANIGDSVVIKGRPGFCSSDEGKVFVTGKGTETVNGVSLRYFDMKDDEDSAWGWSSTIVGGETETIRVYERIGPAGSYFFPEQRCVFDYAEGGTLRCYEDAEIGNLNYSFPYVECDFMGHTIGMDELRDENRTDVFPNPCNGTISVSLNTETELACTIGIYDVTGTLVYSEHIRSATPMIDVSRLPHGLYLLRVGLPETGSVISKTFVKQ